MGKKRKKLQPGQVVAFRGAPATVHLIEGKTRRPNGTKYRWIELNTHTGRERITTDHVELYIP